MEFAYLATRLHLRLRCADDHRLGRDLLPLGDLFASLDGIYGSGLRPGFANLEQHSPGYTQWNAAVGWRFDPWSSPKSLTVRLSAINIFDRSYVLREASGSANSPPNIGPRRGLFAELTQQL